MAGLKAGNALPSEIRSYKRLSLPPEEHSPAN